MDGWHNPLWVQQELRRRSRLKNGGFCTVRKAQQDSATLLGLIKACGRQKDLRHGSRIHSDVLKTGLLEKDICLGTSLLCMYAKCGALAKAQEVFDELPVRDAVSWTALIAGYVQHGRGEEALNWFGRMRDEGFSPNAATFVYILKACSSIGATKKGEEIHAEVRRLGLLENHNVVLGTALVDMYAKFGALAKAQEVFDELPTRDVVSWTALIAGYIQHGFGEDALKWFRRMRDEGFFPNLVTFVCVLKACGRIGAIQRGEEIHGEVHSLGLLKNHDTVLANALMDMYVKCGVLARAQEVFDGLPARNLVSWTVLITGYVQHGLGEEALVCFQRMRDEGFSPNTFTFAGILKACGSIGATWKGEEIHAEVRRLGLLENHDIVLGTALVDMYAKCGVLAKAQEVFDKLPERDVVCWNALLAGYVQHGLGDEALSRFGCMRDDGFSPDTATFASILKACGSIGATQEGEEIHAEVQRLGLLENHDFVLGTALVDMYAKCGMLAKAQGVFDELPIWDVVSWNALITGYVQHGLGDEALKCFERMRDEGFSPNTASFVCTLKACGNIGATEKGEEIHAEARRLGLLENHDITLGNALVNMYGKCGLLAQAQEVFDKLSARDVVSWTALMAGYAGLGKAKRVFNSFRQMVREHIEPDGVTFIVLLSACSHAGLVEEGQLYFDIMSNVYCIIPTLEHRLCMVDLFSRAGHFDKAIDMIEKVPVSDLWLAMLGACQKWVNVELGKRAFEHAVWLDNCAAYVCMSNIYAAAGMQEDADNVEALRMKHGAWKLPGSFNASL